MVPFGVLGWGLSGFAVVNPFAKEDMILYRTSYSKRLYMNPEK